MTPVTVDIDADSLDGEVQTTKTGKIEVDFEWLNLDHQYRKSGDWVEKGQEIARITISSVKVETHEVEETIPRWFREDRVVTKTKHKRVEVSNEFIIRAPASGYILRLGGVLGGISLVRKLPISAPVACINDSIIFENKRGGRGFIKVSDKVLKRDEDILFQRALEQFQKVTIKDCTRKVQKRDVGPNQEYHNYDYGFLVGSLSEKEFHNTYRLFDSFNTNGGKPEKTHEYIYYLLDDGEVVSESCYAAVFFQAKEFLAETDDEEVVGGGFVYVLVSSEKPNLVKIGMTERDPEERARELTASTGVSMPYIVAYEARVENPLDAEKKVHSRLSEERVNPNREFFQVPLKKAIATIEEVL